MEQNTATQRSYIPIDMKIKEILDAHKLKESTCAVCGGHNLVKLPDRGRREVLKGERWGSGGIHGRQFTINSQRVCKNCGGCFKFPATVGQFNSVPPNNIDQGFFVNTTSSTRCNLGLLHPELIHPTESSRVFEFKLMP